MNGIVVRFNHKRGFGFITPLTGKPGSAVDVFCHISQCPDGKGLPVGAEVSFDLVRRDAERAQAANVRLVSVSAARVRKESLQEPTA